ncbi:hypothetical protein HY967_00110 [Candidatus Jorgensenbacteria bacterium]|nr:hypothetical protein [Candidatus Jorgensenbacteria bacterium]
MYLYLVLKAPLTEMRAATQLLHECFSAKLRGYGYGSGLVYATPVPIPEDLHETLGVVVWT